MTAAIVVKLGTSLVATADGRIRRAVLRARALEIADIVRAGTPVCVVSSGAIALGLARLGTRRRPNSVPRLQAASALGQAPLHAAWERAFAAHGLAAAQILLTAADVADRTAYVNARNALRALFALPAIPIVNENDATATDEITFGDNDALAAHVALLVRARLLVLLTTVPGLLTHDPATPGAELIADGSHAGEADLGAMSEHGRGGMRSKVLAAQLASQIGIRTVIAGGQGPAVLGPIVAGEQRGTSFTPSDEAAAPESSFKLWLRHGKPASGRIQVDDGARRALLERGASLLAVGVTGHSGDFVPGDAVELVGPDDRAFAKGIVSASAHELAQRARGLEVVHRDRLVLFDG